MNWNILCCPKCRGDLKREKNILVCKKCRSKFSISKGIPDLMSKLDKHAQHQEKIWSSKTYISDPESPDLTTVQERFAQKLIRTLPVPKNGTVVDVGCFIGEKLWYMSSRKKINGIGTDISMPAAQMAKKIDIHGHDFMVADLEKMPFRNNSVDAVLVFDVIEHLSDPKKGFSEVARILKPGGIFLLHIPIKDNKFSLFWWKQKFFPASAKKDYQAVGHTDERMLTTSQIKKHLFKNKLTLTKEIFYNGFLVHFFDREIMRLGGELFAHVSSAKTSETHDRPAPSKIRKLYARLVVPIFEILSLPDWILSFFKIGNTYFVVSKKA